MRVLLCGGVAIEVNGRRLPFEMMFETVGVVRDGRVQRLEFQ